MLSIKNFKIFYLLIILFFSFATQAKDSTEKPLTGKYTEKFHNGNLKYEVNYIDGKKEGLEIFWYISGGKYIQTTYKNDKEDGIWNQWFENGQLKLEAHYKNGKEDGLFTLFYDNGTKRSESNFVNGEKVGYETYWERNGDVKSKTLYKSKSLDKDNKPAN